VLLGVTPVLAVSLLLYLMSDLIVHLLMLQSVHDCLHVEVLVSARMTWVHIHVEIFLVEIEALVVVVSFQGFAVEIPLLVLATVASVHVHIIGFVVVVGTFVSVLALQVSSIQVELLIFTVVASVEVKVAIVVVVVHASVTMSRLDATGKCWIDWLRPIILLISTTMTLVHVDVLGAVVVVQAFACVMSRFEILTIEEPLLVFSSVTIVHVHIVGSVVHVEALVVVVGLQTFIVHVPPLICFLVAVVHVDIPIVVIVVHALIVVSRLQWTRIGRLVIHHLHRLSAVIDNVSIIGNTGIILVAKEGGSGL